MAVLLKDVVDIMISNQATIDRRSEVTASLGTPPWIAGPLRDGYTTGSKTPFEYYKGLLEDWIMRNGTRATLSALINILEADEFQATADQLQLLKGRDDKVIVESETPMDDRTEVVAPIVEIRNNKEFIIDYNNLKAVLKKAGNRRVIVLSVNGRARVGKSFRINQFLAYLTNHGINATSSDWVHHQVRRGFASKWSASTTTSGIDIWKEPIIVDDVAIILIDCQGVHDQNTDRKLNAKLFAFSILFSSIFIYVDKQTTKDVLEFLKEFVGIASNLNTGRGNRGFLEKFIFQVVNYGGPYAHGFYDEGTDTIANYRTHFLEKDATIKKSLEEISNSFSTYLMPHPGLILPNPGVDVTNWADNFRTHVVGSVESVFSSQNGLESCIKRIGEEFMTGESLIGYLDVLAQTFSQGDSFPNLKSHLQTTGEWQGRLVCNKSLQFYNSKVDQLLEQNQDGVATQALDSKHEVFKTEALRMFRESVILILDNQKALLVLELENAINRIWSSAKIINYDRLHKAEDRNNFQRQEGTERTRREEFENKRRIADASAMQSNAISTEIQNEIQHNKRRDIEAAIGALEVAKGQLKKAQEIKCTVENATSTHEIHDETVNAHQGSKGTQNYRINQETLQRNIKSAEKLLADANEGVRVAEERLRIAQL